MASIPQYGCTYSMKLRKRDYLESNSIEERKANKQEKCLFSEAFVSHSNMYKVTCIVFVPRGSRNSAITAFLFCRFPSCVLVIFTLAFFSRPTLAVLNTASLKLNPISLAPLHSPNNDLLRTQEHHNLF